MTNHPGPQRALGSRGQTINASAWPYFDGLIRKVSAVTGVSYDQIIVEGTRTYARQKFLYENRNKPGFNPAYPPDSPYAYHVAGDAVDFGAGAGMRGTPVQKALHQYGASFGIFFEVSNELWHGRCDLSRVPNLDPAGGGATPIEPEETEEDDMTPEQDMRLKYIEAALLKDNGGGIAARVTSADNNAANAANIASEVRNKIDDPNVGLRKLSEQAVGLLQSIIAILAIDDGGGIREKINRIIRKTGA